jgi:hypothetical protein
MCLTIVIRHNHAGEWLGQLAARILAETGVAIFTAGTRHELAKIFRPLHQLFLLQQLVFRSQTLRLPPKWLSQAFSELLHCFPPSWH